ncbi:MAG: hypothetical protein E7503_04965 [Ruminococcus sp.]|nr:hypothetical protein [Ruminococcus sp.]
MRTSRKYIAALTAAAMGIVSLPAVISTSAADDVIYATDFEDGEILFTGRGGVEVIEATTELPHGGSYSMCISGREKSWNGPQFLLDELCEPNVEYTVSAWAKSEWYSTLSLSMEYTDTEGERHYSNLKSFSGDAWNEFSEIKFSFTADMTNVYLYFESSDASCKLYVDDFVIAPAPVIPIQDDIPSLSDLYSPYYNIGTAIMASNLSSPSFMDLVQKHFDDSITFGNELKPDSVLDKAACQAMAAEGDDTNPQVTLSASRGLLNYCRDNNLPVRGHVLVWHSQTPDWFFKENYADDGAWVTKDEMLVRMENYIKNVFAALESEYPTVDIYAWDVVNEAWLDNGSPRNPGEQGSSGSNNSAWVQVFGDNSFIEPAFEYARKYAPEGTKLYYNDFNEYMPEKTAAIVKMATALQEKGLIDGIGCQSHLDVSFPGISAYEKAIAAFAATGLDVQITELDATTSDTSESGLATQAQYYSDIMDVLVKYADSISAVVFWGVTDDQSWRATRLPLLFDAAFQAKPAYYSIVDGLEMPDLPETTTTTTVTTTETTVTSVTGGEYTVLGDTNCDDLFKIADVILLNRFLAEDDAITITDVGMANADFNQDGDINGDDAVAMLKNIAALD